MHYFGYTEDQTEQMLESNREKWDTVLEMARFLRHERAELATAGIAGRRP